MMRTDGSAKKATLDRSCMHGVCGSISTQPAVRAVTSARLSLIKEEIEMTSYRIANIEGPSVLYLEAANPTNPTLVLLHS